MRYMKPYDFWGPGSYVPNVIRGRTGELTCDRCFERTNVLFKYFHSELWDTENWGWPIPLDIREIMWLCWDCDTDVINGGDIDADSVDVINDREIENYETDPLWYDPPEGYYD